MFPRAAALTTTSRHGGSQESQQSSGSGPVDGTKAPPGRLGNGTLLTATDVLSDEWACSRAEINSAPITESWAALRGAAPTQCEDVT